MLNRRLLIVFALFVLGFCALGFRLAHLQINEAESSREEMRSYVHHSAKIETARGSIVDRNGMKLAYDDACYDLAIDYRAMNLDDRWLTGLARERIKNETLTRQERIRRIAAVKAEIAAQVEAIPDAIAKICDTSALTEPSPDAPPKEKILAQFNQIRQRIAILRQDHWSRAYNPLDDKMRADGGEALDDAAFHEPLKEEHIQHTILPHISDQEAFYFRQHAEDFPGIVVVDSLTRRYPFGEAACHILGTMRNVDAATEKRDPFVLPNLLSDDDKGNLAGYLPGDRMGELGLEKLLEPELRGTRGVRLLETTNVPSTGPAGGMGGAFITQTTERRIDPVAGQSVRLTLDIGLQKDIEGALHAPGGTLLKGKDGKDHVAAIVVMSLDGQVLAMVSSVGFDPNTIDETRAALNSSSNYARPLGDRALEPFAPGSTVKPLLASAALTEGVITPQTTFTSIGYLIPGRPNIFKDDVHGTFDLVQAITESCNVYFYNVGDRLGVVNLAKWYHLYGLGRETGFELPDRNGDVVDPATVANDPEGARTVARFLGIGEGPIDATPLQMANAYATLLRGGEWIAPRILAETPASSAQPFVLSAATLATVKEGMRGVVTSGTGRSSFRGFKLAVGGKTGTADVDNKPVFDDAGNPVYDMNRPLMNRDQTPMLGPDKKPLYRRAYEKGTHAWFVGYAPADNPKFVVAAVMEFGGHGGSFAAPLVREAFLQLERHGYLPQVDVP